MIIVADFGKMLKIEDYQTIIADKVKDLDIGVLICCAGVSFKNFYHEESDQAIQDTCVVNSLQPAYLTKVLTP